MLAVVYKGSWDSSSRIDLTLELFPLLSHPAFLEQYIQTANPSVQPQNIIMVADSAFEGWCGLAANSAEGNMVWQGFQPKQWEETDVDIEVRAIKSFPIASKC